MKFGSSGRASGGIHEDGFASLWYLWEGLQSGDYLKRHMRAVHEGMAPQCTICTIIYLSYYYITVKSVSVSVCLFHHFLSKTKMAITQSIFKLETPNFAW